MRRFAGCARLGPVRIRELVFSAFCRRFILRTAGPPPATAPTTPPPPAWLITIGTVAGCLGLILVAVIMTVVFVIGGTVIGCCRSRKGRGDCLFATFGSRRAFAGFGKLVGPEAFTTPSALPPPPPPTATFATLTGAIGGSCGFFRLFGIVIGCFVLVDLDLIFDVGLFFDDGDRRQLTLLNFLA